MARSCTLSVGRWLPVVLLLLAVGPNYVLSAACSDTVTECSNIFSDLSASVGNAGDVSAFCASAIQNATACVDQAKTDCQGEDPNPTDNLDQQLASLKNSVCSPDGMCSLKFVQCVKILTAEEGPDEGSSPVNMTDFKQICTSYPSVKRCLDNLDDDCRKKPQVQETISGMAQVAALCENLTNKGKCPDALPCFSSLMSSRESPDKCTPMINVLECLKTTAQLETCALDESQISFQDVKDIMTEMCPEVDMDCEAASECMEPQGLPKPSGEQDSMPTLTLQLTDPGVYCRFMLGAAKCFVDKKETCGYSDEYEMTMKNRWEELKAKCPAAPSGKAARMSPGVFCFLMAVFTTLLSICSRP